MIRKTSFLFFSVAFAALSASAQRRLGSISGDGSGDIFIAFSTANAGAGLAAKPTTVTMLPNEQMDALFEATVQATEEAVVNAMVAADTMTGFKGHTVEALPHDKLREILKKYNRLTGAH
jgi:D-aminopeptidase